MSYQSVQILGNVGGEPEVKQAGTVNICNFSVAVSDKFTDRQGQHQQRTEWFKCSAFGKLADVCSKFCTKGKQVFIVGELRTNKWEDKNGNKRESISLIVQKMKLLGAGDKKPTGNQQPMNNENNQPFGDVEIPF